MAYRGGWEVIQRLPEVPHQRNRPAEPCEARGGKFEMGGGLATDCRCALQAGGTGAPAALARASRQPRGVSAQMSFWG